MVSGIVFLGCPHPGSDHPDNCRKLSFLLQEATRLSKRVVDSANSSIATVVNIAKNFEESDTAVDILSIYEGKPTKTKLFRREIVSWTLQSTGLMAITADMAQKLVDEFLARTRARREKVIKVDVTHAKLCTVLPASRLHTELAQFLAVVQLHTIRDQNLAMASGAVPYTTT